jgi:predicted acetyltransferase
MQVNISAAAYPEKSILRNLMQYYLYEFSLSPETEPDDTGQFQYPYLDRYWIEPERLPYLVRVNGGLAGFVLLRRGTYFPQQLINDHGGMLVAEFFVMKAFRRRGVGSQAALDLFARFPGRWEIAQETSNQAGQAFWWKLISDYCGGEFKEYVLDNDSWCGPVQVFDNFAFAAN